MAVTLTSYVNVIPQLLDIFRWDLMAPDRRVFRCTRGATLQRPARQYLLD